MRIHIISIAGNMTANIAVDLVNKGHQVSGSDQENIFPPVSTLLEDVGIEVNKHPITTAIDMAIIGSSYLKFERTKKEFEEILKLKIPYISATEYISQNIIKENSILIAGSYGKSTITSLLSWILINANLKPSVMLGAKNINNFPSYINDNSNYSVVEADESINGLDKKAKFLYYPSKYLLITSSHWEHKDCYPTEAKNKDAFQNLINNTNKNGFVIINQNDSSNNNLEIPENLQKITYNTNKSDYYIKKINTSNYKTELTIQASDKEYKVTTSLLGLFNFENVLAAFTLAHNLQIDPQIIIKSIETYLGIEKRLQIIKQNDNNYLIDDFAQSAPRIKSAIESIKLHFPKHIIISIFHPHASFLQFISGLDGMDKAFKESDKIILSKLKINPDKSKRITFQDYKNIIGDKLIYLPDEKDILYYLENNIKNNSVIINFSSGGIKNHQLLNQIKELI